MTTFDFLAVAGALTVVLGILAWLALLVYAYVHPNDPPPPDLDGLFTEDQALRQLRDRHGRRQ